MKSNLKIVNKTKSLNFKKIAQTRRQRGYNWEDTLVKRFNKMENWKAFRLGSPSVALPDILCVNNIDSIIFTIEAKSGTGTTLTVPFDQIIRCLSWTNNFTVYKTRKVILAFKFLSKKRIGVGKYEKRELREFYKIWNAKKDSTYFGLIEIDHGIRIMGKISSTSIPKTGQSVTMNVSFDSKPNYSFIVENN